MPDAKDDNFYKAIFHNNDNAVLDLAIEELDQARRYIVHGEGTSLTCKWRHQMSKAAAVLMVHAAVVSR